jgi:hypothetical protein
MLKLCIGAFLVLSLCILALALIALLAASKNRSSGRSGGLGFVSHQHFGRFWCPMRVWFWPWPVQVGGGGAAAVATGAAVHRPDMSMSFAEAVFSFIFGDGPPEKVDESHFLSLRAFVSSKGPRLIRAYEFGPFLVNPLPLPARDSALVLDEGFMPSILAVLRGDPVASDDGRLAYRFPGARGQTGANPQAKCFRERKHIFSLASAEQQKLAVGLGIANLVCLMLVWTQIRDESKLQMASLKGGIVFGGAVRAVNWLFPALIVYAVAFVLIPTVRWHYIKHINRQIDARNEQRELWARRISGESFA